MAKKKTETKSQKPVALMYFNAELVGPVSSMADVDAAIESGEPNVRVKCSGRTWSHATGWGGLAAQLSECESTVDTFVDEMGAYDGE